MVRTTNLLERLHREARRKQHDIGMFQSERGCEVLWYRMAMRETAKQQALGQCHRTPAGPWTTRQRPARLIYDKACEADA